MSDTSYKPSPYRWAVGFSASIVSVFAWERALAGSSYAVALARWHPVGERATAAVASSLVIITLAREYPLAPAELESCDHKALMHEEQA